jgi:hypothetical protein
MVCGVAQALLRKRVMEDLSRRWLETRLADALSDTSVVAYLSSTQAIISGTLRLPRK